MFYFSLLSARLFLTVYTSELFYLYHMSLAVIGAQEWRFDVPFDLPTYAISPEMVQKVL